MGEKRKYCFAFVPTLSLTSPKISPRNWALNKKQKIVIHIGTVIGLIFRYISTYILSKEAGTVIKTTWGYTQWHSILLSMSIFIIIKDLKIYERISKNEKLKNIIKEIAGCSFGIYLIHMLVKHYLVRIFNLNILAWEFRTFGIILVYCTSLAIVWMLKKVPIVKKVLP